jgi:hypothetical protein
MWDLGDASTLLFFYRIFTIFSVWLRRLKREEPRAVASNQWPARGGAAQ